MTLLRLLIIGAPNGIAYAVDPAAEVAPDMAAQLVRVILSLIGIVVLILSTAWLTRRLQGGGQQPGQRMHCLESRAVGVKERVVLLQVGDTHVLLGIAPGNVSLLHVFASPVSEMAMTAKSPQGFGQLLATLQRRGES